MNKKKLKNVEFIKRVSNIRVRTECNKEDVDTSNFYKMNVSLEKLQRIKDNIDKEIKDIYNEYNKDTTL